jgi:Learning-associated protein.
MAKSLRSKRKRKLRAIKRERYAKKELAQLKRVLGINENGDVEMNNISEIATGN